MNSIFAKYETNNKKTLKCSKKSFDWKRLMAQPFESNKKFRTANLKRWG